MQLKYYPYIINYYKKIGNGLEPEYIVNIALKQ